MPARSFIPPSIKHRLGVAIKKGKVQGDQRGHIAFLVLSGDNLNQLHQFATAVWGDNLLAIDTIGNLYLQFPEHTDKPIGQLLITDDFKGL